MQVGHLSKLLGYQSAIQGIKSSHAMVLLAYVGLHEIYVWSQIIKQRTGKLATKHRDTDIRILLCQRPYHRYHHCHIAQSRETDDQYMLFLH